MKPTILVGLFAFSLFAATAASAVTIDFETMMPAPDVFEDADLLREEYAGVGVHFEGFAPVNSAGGAVLDDRTWGLNAKVSQLEKGTS